MLPEGQEDSIADDDPNAPQYGQSEGDVLEVVVGACEKVPGHQLL